MSDSFFAYQTYSLLLAEEIRPGIDASVAGLASAVTEVSKDRPDSLEAWRQFVEGIPELNKFRVSEIAEDIKKMCPNAERLSVAVSLACANMLSAIRLKESELEITLPDFDVLVHSILMAYVRHIKPFSHLYLKETPQGVLQRHAMIDISVAEGVRKNIPIASMLDTWLGQHSKDIAEALKNKSLTDPVEAEPDTAQAVEDASEDKDEDKGDIYVGPDGSSTKVPEPAEPPAAAEDVSENESDNESEASPEPVEDSQAQEAPAPRFDYYQGSPPADPPHPDPAFKDFPPPPQAMAPNPVPPPAQAWNPSGQPQPAAPYQAQPRFQ